MVISNLLTTLQNGARARLRSISLPYTNASVGIANVLLNHGFIHNFTRGTRAGPSPAEFLKASPGGRRLWIDLKYGNDDRAVMGHALCVSKPSRKITMDSAELLRLVTGRRAKFVNPLGLGEIAIVRCNVREPKEQPIATSIADQARQQAEATAAAAAAAAAQAGEEAQAAKEVSGTRRKETFLEAREAVGRGLGGEVIARVG